MIFTFSIQARSEITLLYMRIKRFLSSISALVRTVTVILIYCSVLPIQESTAATQNSRNLKQDVSANSIQKFHLYKYQRYIKTCRCKYFRSQYRYGMSKMNLYQKDSQSIIVSLRYNFSLSTED